jgi:HAD superfamily hydrolase (TIGR01484 family)
VSGASLVVCSDLDRTLLPNGPQAESPQARPTFRALAARPEVTLIYVTGRHLAILRQAIAEYDLPEPAFAVGDVGTTVYQVSGGSFRKWEAWEEEIAADWGGLERPDLAALLQGVGPLRLQEEEKQGAFKLSYYVPPDLDAGGLLAAVRERLEPTGTATSLIWSVDESLGRGLLDVLPARATKLHAIRFLLRQGGLDEERTVFAGDSGNDLPVLVSGLRSVLVRNAIDTVREEAVRRAEAAGSRDRLYLARGGFRGMNGCYAAGVVEGVAHFFGEEWIPEP